MLAGRTKPRTSCLFLALGLFFLLGNSDCEMNRAELIESLKKNQADLSLDFDLLDDEAKEELKEVYESCTDEERQIIRTSISNTIQKIEVLKGEKMKLDEFFIIYIEMVQSSELDKEGNCYKGTITALKENI